MEKPGRPAAPARPDAELAQQILSARISIPPGTRSADRGSVLALMVVAPMIWLVATLARDQIAEGNEHNSWFQRIEWYQQSVTIWWQQPLTGHGLRSWTQPEAPGRFQPPNVFLEVMASAGLLGLGGFVAMILVVLLALWRMPRAYGTLALAVVLIRLVQAQLDIFWVSPSVSIPFLITGVLIGAASRNDLPQPRHAGRLLQESAR